MVEETVENNPGIRFTGLKKETGLANGTLQYHLCKSESIIRNKGSFMQPESCSHCELSQYCQEKCLHGVMRQKLKKEIVRMIKEDHSQKEMAEELGRDPSTISYHVHRLEELGALEEGEPVEGLPV